MCINNFYRLLLFSLCFSMVFYEYKADTVPACNNSLDSLLLVSTLDGHFTALNIDNGGVEQWSIATDPGPLLNSNIHNLELTENAQWIRLIPSLNGGLYKFNGENIQPVPVNTDSLLSTSLRFSDDVIISGGKEVHSYGLDIASGQIFYECSMTKCDNSTKTIDNYTEIIVLQRSTHTVRAVDPYSGYERWNYSVSQHDVRLPPNVLVDCSFDGNAVLDIDFKVIVPDGVILALSKSEPGIILWQHKFPFPIANIWSLVGRQLRLIDLFGASYTTNSINGRRNLSPPIYIGMHERQLYIQESTALSRYILRSCGLPSGINCLPKFPWLPFPATKDRLSIGSGLHKIPELTDESSSVTALSVLYGSEYVNGNGYYLYDIELDDNQSEIDNDNDGASCHRKPISELAIYNDVDINDSIMQYVNKRSKHPEIRGSVVSLSHWWKEILAVGTATAFFVHLMCYERFHSVIMKFKTMVKKKKLKGKRAKVITTPETDSGVHSIENIGHNDNGSTLVDYNSRFTNDFEPLCLLGKGGFGIVFEAKKSNRRLSLRY